MTICPCIARPEPRYPAARQSFLRSAAAVAAAAALSLGVGCGGSGMRTAGTPPDPGVDAGGQVEPDGGGSYDVDQITSASRRR